MSKEPEFFTYTREEFPDEFVHPDDRPALALVFHEAWLLTGAPKRKNAPELG